MVGGMDAAATHQLESGGKVEGNLGRCMGQLLEDHVFFSKFVWIIENR